MWRLKPSRRRKVRRCEERAMKGDLNIVEASRSFSSCTRFLPSVDFTRWGLTGNYLLLSNPRRLSETPGHLWF